MNQSIFPKYFILVATAFILNACSDNSTETAAAPIVPTANVGELKFAYVNNDSLMEHYSMTADLQEELIQERMGLENAFKSEYEKFEKDYRDAEAGASQLSPEALQILQNKLAQRENELRNYKAQLDEQLYTIEDEKNNRYLTEIQQFLDAYAKAEGYHIIYGYNGLGNVLYMDKQFDITNQVVDSLNVLYEAAKGEVADETDE